MWRVLRGRVRRSRGIRTRYVFLGVNVPESCLMGQARAMTLGQSCTSVGHPLPLRRRRAGAAVLTLATLAARVEGSSTPIVGAFVPALPGLAAWAVGRPSWPPARAGSRCNGRPPLGRAWGRVRPLAVDARGEVEGGSDSEAGRGDEAPKSGRGGGQRGKGSFPAKGQRTPTLPPGEFRPKQSLGQNYLSDQNYVMKICNTFADKSEGGRCVVELGPGAGALTHVLYERFPKMVAVDIDPRAVELLQQSIPGLGVVLSDVLQIDYTALATLRGGGLSIIGNLPYHITSQILFSLCDHYRSIKRAVVTMQLEVAQRVVAKPGSKEYGVLSVVFQLYGRPRILFQIPRTVFFPEPNVTSALIKLDFTGKGPGVDQGDLRRVLATAFQQRRKMLRQSLKALLKEEGAGPLPEHFATKRPQQLTPQEFVELTKAVLGDKPERPVGESVWRAEGGAAGAGPAGQA